MEDLHIAEHLRAARGHILRMLLFLFVSGSTGCLHRESNPSAPALAPPPSLPSLTWNSKPPRLLSPLALPGGDSRLFQSNNGRFFGRITHDPWSNTARVLVYGTATGTLLGDWWVGSSMGVAAAISDDGTSLLLASKEGKALAIQWIDLDTGQARRPAWRVASGLASPVVGFSSKGNRMLVPGAGCTYELRSTEREQPLTTFEIPCEATLVPAADLEAVIVGIAGPSEGEEPGTLEVRRTLDAKGRPLLLEGCPSQPLKAAAMSSDGHSLVAVFYENPPLLWDLATGGPPRPLIGPGAASGFAYAPPLPRFSPDNRRLSFIRSSDGAIGWWDLASSDSAPPRRVNPPQEGLQRLSSKNSLLAGAPEAPRAIYLTGEKIVLVDVSSGKVVAEIKSARELLSVEDAIITPDATRVLTRSDAIIPSLAEGPLALSSDGRRQLKVQGDWVTVRDVAADAIIVAEQLGFENIYYADVTPESSVTLVVSAQNIETRETRLVLHASDPRGGANLRSLELSSTWPEPKVPAGQKKVEHVSVRRSPDTHGRFLLVKHEQGLLRADLERWEVLPSLEGMPGEPRKGGPEPLLAPVLAATFSADGKRVLAVGLQGQASVMALCEWEQATGKKQACRPLGRVQSTERAPRFGAFLPGGERFILDESIYDVTTLERIGRLQELSPLDVRTSTFSADGSRLLLVYQGGPLQLFDVATGKRLAELFFWSNDGWLVLDSEGRYDGSRSSLTAGFWWRSGDELIPFARLHEQLHEPGLLGKLLGGTSAPLLPMDSSRPLAPAMAGAVEWRSPDEPRLRLRLWERSGGIGRIRVALDGKQLPLELRTDGRDCRRQRKELDCDVSLAPILDQIPERAVHIPGGATTPNILEIEAENAAGTLSSAPLEIGFERPERDDPEQRRAVSSPASGPSAPVEDGETRTAGPATTEGTPPVRLVAAWGTSQASTAVVGPDNPRGPRLVLTFSPTRTVATLWNADTGEELVRLEGHTLPIKDAAFSSDSRWVVTASEDESIRAWDVTTGAGQVLGHETEGILVQVRFSPAGHRVISGSTTGRIGVWDAGPLWGEGGNGTPRASPSRDVHEAMISCLQFSPDGRWLLSGDFHGGGVLWDTRTWEPVRVLQPVPEISEVSCHGDGRHLVRSGSSRVEVWDLTTGRLARRIELGAGLRFFAVSPDLREGLFGAEGGELALWNIQRGERLRILREGDEKQHELWIWRGDYFLFRQDQGPWHFDVNHWRAVRLNDSAPAPSSEIPPTKSDSAAPTTESTLSVTWAPDGRYAVMSMKPFPHLEVWKPTLAAGGTPVLNPASVLMNGRVDKPRQVFFEPVESGRMLVATERGTSLWDGRSDIPSRAVPLVLPPGAKPGNWVLAGVSLTPDGKSIVGFPVDWPEEKPLILARAPVDADTATSLRQTEPESMAWNGELLMLASSPFGQRLIDQVRVPLVDAGSMQAGTGELEDTVRLLAPRARPDGSQQPPYEVLQSYAKQELKALAPNGRFFVTRGWLPPGADHGRARIVLFVYDTEKGVRMGHAEGVDAATVVSALISPDGQAMLTRQMNSELVLWDLRNPRAPRPVHTFFAMSFRGNAMPAFSKKGDMLFLGWTDGTVQQWSVESLLGPGHEHAQPVQSFPRPGSPIPGHSGPILSLDVSADGRFLLTVGTDSTARLWDAHTGLELCKLFSFDDGTWAVVDPSGRYDASNGGEIDGLYWVVGFETIRLSQLKNRYYEPGLLARLMGFSSEPLRDVRRFEAPRLYPDVKAEVRGPASAPSLHLALTERGGGIGRTLVAINGKEVLQISWERSGPSSPRKPHVESVDPDAAKRAHCEPSPGQLTCDLPLEPLFRYFQSHPVRLPGARTEAAPQRPVNRISLRAFNDEEYLVSKPVTLEFSPPRAGERGNRDVDLPVTESELVVPRLWAVVAGVSDYTGGDIDLHYAAKDADDFARALEAAARRLLCSAEDVAAGRTCERVHIRRLSTTGGHRDLCLPTVASTGSGTERFTEPEGDGRSCPLKPPQDACSPDKANLLRALKELEQAEPQDIVVVYLAGHGVTLRNGNQQAYHYLTRDAWSLDMSDPELRCGATLSSASLNEALQKSPATKQVMILDTCHSGAMVLKMTSSRGMSSSQVRAMEQMQDQTGMYVLAGAPSDASSYESPEFGQGVLTYSLLKGMSAEGLAEESLVDVGRLFEYASKKVPELARGMSRAQRPVVAMPRGGGNFFIGQVMKPERETILEHLVMEPRPRFVVPTFFERDSWLDSAGVKAAVISELRDRSYGSPPELAFADVLEWPGAYQLVGSYRMVGGERAPLSLEMSARVFKDGKRVGCEFRVPGPRATRRGGGNESVPSEQELKSLASDLVRGALEEIERAKSPTPPVCRP